MSLPAEGEEEKGGGGEEDKERGQRRPRSGRRGRRREKGKRTKEAEEWEERKKGERKGRKKGISRRRKKGERRCGEESRRERGKIRGRLSSDMHLIKQATLHFATLTTYTHTPSNTLCHSADQEAIGIQCILTFSMTRLSVSLLRSHHPTPVFLNSSHERSSFWTHGTAESSSISASE